VPDPILPGRAGLYLSMLHYGLVNNGRFVREHMEFFNRLLADEGPLDGRRVLDIGCGKSYWLSLLVASAGATAIGIDTEAVDATRGIAKYKQIFRRNGFERTLRTGVWDVLFAHRYYNALERRLGKPLPHASVDLRVYDGTHIPLADASVDLVVSHEVFEHIADVRAVLAEVARVLKPSGKTYIYIHNYTSVSGGHHIAWKYPDSEPSRVVPPWDHLRGRRYCDIPSWLNRVREHEYRELFAEFFDIIEWRHTATEGAGLLTEAIRTELSAYSESELLTKGLLVRARTRSPASKSGVH